MLSERDRIKKKIQKINPNKWKSDNFDVRYYLISQLKKPTLTLLAKQFTTGLTYLKPIPNNMAINSWGPL